jgi:hypothetical protein
MESIMSIQRRVAAFVIAWGPLLAGCVEGRTVEDLGEARLADRMGTTGTNGCASDERMEQEANLTYATGKALVASGTNKVSWEIEDTLLTTQAGINVFKYAVQCAVPAGVTVTWPGGAATGMGILHEGADWLKGPLSQDVQYQVHACVVAHVNPYDIHVPLLLSGPAVNDDGGKHVEYGVDEALWVSRRNVDDVLIHIAWPLKALKSQCGPNPFDALKLRVCGQDPEGCTLMLGDPQDCTFDPASEGFYCLGQPALMTTLQTPGLEELYPGCF